MLQMPEFSVLKSFPKFIGPYFMERLQNTCKTSLKRYKISFFRFFTKECSCEKIVCRGTEVTWRDKVDFAAELRWFAAINKILPRNSAICRGDGFCRETLPPTVW